MRTIGTSSEVRAQATHVERVSFMARFLSNDHFFVRAVRLDTALSPPGQRRLSLQPDGLTPTGIRPTLWPTCPPREGSVLRPEAPSETPHAW